MKHFHSIKHLDELNFIDFLNFIKDFNKNYNNYEISEKIDGQNFSIGIENWKLYTKTKKSQKVFNPKFYEGAIYRNGFENIHKNINISEINFLIQFLYKLLCINCNNPNIQFFFEILPFKQTNNIKYKYEKVAILLDIYINNKSIYSKLSKLNLRSIIFHLDLCINDWTFYLKNTYNFNNLNINHIDLFENIYEKYKNILFSRKKIYKLKKNKVKDILKMIQMNIKNQLLKKIENFDSLFNSKTIEGVVIMKNDVNVKVVNKNNFSEKNELQQGINREIGFITKELNTEIKKMFNNHDLLTNFVKIFEKIEIELFDLKAFNQNRKFHNYQEILNIILKDIKSENNIIINTKNEIINKINEINKLLSKKTEILYFKWNNEIKFQQTNNNQKITKEKFINLFEKLGKLNKCEFLEKEKIESILIEILIPDSIKYSLMEKYIWN
jgi:hypothetical protein